MILPKGSGFNIGVAATIIGVVLSLVIYHNSLSLDPIKQDQTKQLDQIEKLSLKDEQFAQFIIQHERALADLNARLIAIRGEIDNGERQLEERLSIVTRLSEDVGEIKGKIELMQKDLDKVLP